MLRATRGLVGTLMRISDVNDIFPLAKRYLVVLLFVGRKHLFLKFPTNYVFDGKEMRWTRTKQSGDDDDKWNLKGDSTVRFFFRETFPSIAIVVVLAQSPYWELHDCSLPHDIVTLSVRMMLLNFFLLESQNRASSCIYISAICPTASLFVATSAAVTKQFTQVPCN